MIIPDGVSFADYTAAIEAGNKQKVKILFPNQEIEIGENNIVLGQFELTSVLNGADDLTVGKCVSSQFKTTLLNTDGTLSSINYIDNFDVYMGVEIDGDFEFVCVGSFIGQKPKKVLTQTIELIGYDKMSLLDADAKDFLNGLTYPMTLGQIYAAVCTEFGLSPITADAGANISVSIETSPFGGNGVTYKDIIGWIAEAAGCYARITHDGNGMELVFYTDHTSDYEIDGNGYFNIDVAEYAVPAVDCVNVSVTESDIGSQYPASGTFNNIYKITDNPYISGLTALDLEGKAENIYDILHTMSAYRPIHCTAIGNWLIQPGDIITVTGLDNSDYALPVFSMTMRYTGMCISDYQSTGNEVRDTQTAVQRQIVRNAYRYHEFENDVDSLRSLIVNTTSRIFMQLDDPTEDNEVKTGDIWVKSLNTGTWNGVKAYTWGFLKNYTWSNIMGNFSTYVYDGNGWTTISDMSLLIEKSTQIEQTDEKVNLCATVDGSRTAGAVKTSTSAIEIYGDHLNVGSDGDVNIRSGGSLNIDSGGRINITSDAEFIVNTPNLIISPNNMTVRGNIYSFGGMYSITEEYGFAYNKNSAQYKYSGFEMGGSTFYGAYIDSGFIMFHPGAFNNIPHKDLFMLRNIPIPVGGGEFVQCLQFFATDEEGTSSQLGRPGSGKGFTWGYIDEVIYYTLTQQSSRKVKHDINDLPEMGETIDRLNPVSYKYNRETNGKTHYGLIYEDTKEVLPDICRDGGTDSESGINYMELVGILLKEVQSLRKRVAALEKLHEGGTMNAD